LIEICFPLQEFQHIDYSQYHPFRIDPLTVPTLPLHFCKLCGWEHSGEHLIGRPRAYWLVADGQGELYVDNRGNRQCRPAKDEWGMARMRFEYPRHRPRETADGTEKEAPKIYDDFIDVDKALAGYVFYMAKSLSSEERLKLRYREILEQAQGATLEAQTPPCRFGQCSASRSRRLLSRFQTLYRQLDI
jgi:hypothetical protein